MNLTLPPEVPCILHIFRQDVRLTLICVIASPSPLRSVSPLPPSVQHHDDPPEVDISEHHYYPTKSSTSQSTPPLAQAPMMNPFGGQDADIRQMMMEHPLFRNMPRDGTAPPFADMPGVNATPGAEGIAQDPMLEMMQKLMGGANGGIPGLGMGAPPGQVSSPKNGGWDLMWKLLHLAVMVFVTLYVVGESRWTGMSEERLKPREKQGGHDLFYYFAGTELALQSGRFLLEKGRLQGDGWMAFLASNLPQPWGMYLETAARYSIIWTTIVRDGLVIIFTLGIVSWWNALHA
jgi:GET complex subunit GET2